MIGSILGIFGILFIGYLISNAFYFETIKGEFEKGGFFAAFNFSLGLMIHQIAIVIVKIASVFLP